MRPSLELKQSYDIDVAETIVKEEEEEEEEEACPLCWRAAIGRSRLLAIEALYVYFSC